MRPLVQRARRSGRHLNRLRAKIAAATSPARGGAETRVISWKCSGAVGSVVQRASERLRIDERFRQPPEVSKRRIEKAVPLESKTAARALPLTETDKPLQIDSASQAIGGALGRGGRGAVPHQTITSASPGTSGKIVLGTRNRQITKKSGHSGSGIESEGKARQRRLAAATQTASVATTWLQLDAASSRSTSSVSADT